MEFGSTEKEALDSLRKTREILLKRQEEWLDMREKITDSVFDESKKPDSSSPTQQKFIRSNSILNNKETKIAIGELSHSLVILEMALQRVISVCLSQALDEDSRHFISREALFGCHAVKKLITDMVEEFCSKRVPNTLESFTQIVYPSSERQNILMQFLEDSTLCIVCEDKKPDLRCSQTGKPYCKECFISKS